MRQNPASEPDIQRRSFHYRGKGIKKFDIKQENAKKFTINTQNRPFPSIQLQ